MAIMAQLLAGFSSWALLLPRDLTVVRNCKYGFTLLVAERQLMRQYQTDGDQTFTDVMATAARLDAKGAPAK